MDLAPPPPRVVLPWWQRPRLVWALSVGLVVALVVGLGAYFWQPVRLWAEEFIAKQIDARVSRVLISGVVYTPPAALRTALGVARGDTLVGFSVDAARLRLEALDWVQTATVTRKLPDTLEIKILEYIPVVRVELNDGLWVADKTGKLIAEADSRHDALPALRGAGAAEAAGDLLQLLGQDPAWLKTLHSADFIGERRWDIVVGAGLRVMLPEENPTRALRLLTELERRRQVSQLTGSTLDLRLADRIVLRLPQNSRMQIL